MEISSEYLADLLIGIVRAQNAIVDAVDRASPGFRNTHLIPVLNVAANIRIADPRLIDLPSRVLLRLQGRAAVDNAAVKADLERLLAAGHVATPAASPAPAAPAAAATARPVPAAAAPVPPVAPAALRPAAGAAPAATAAAARPAPAAVAPAAAPRPAPAPGAPASGEDLDFSKP